MRRKPRMMPIKRNFVWSRAGWALLGCGALVCLPTQFCAPAGAAETPQIVAPQPTEPLGLTVEAGNCVKRTGPATGLLEYGTVDVMTTPKIEHDFTLRNDNRTPVTIARLQASCGCTSVLLGEDEATSKTLAPGEQVK